MIILKNSKSNNLNKISLKIIRFKNNKILKVKKKIQVLIKLK